MSFAHRSYTKMGPLVVEAACTEFCIARNDEIRIVAPINTEAILFFGSVVLMVRFRIVEPKDEGSHRA